MKKSLLMILTAALACMILATVAIAAGTGEIAVASATGAPGETVTISVSLKSNPGVAYLNIPITYDSTKLEAPVISGTGLTGWQVGTSALWADAADTTYTGDILSLTFKIKEGTSGTANVSVGIIEAWNASEEAVGFNKAPGTITITSSTPTPTATPKPTVKLSSDAKTAQISGDFSGLYARIALIIDRGGASGLYVTQASIKKDGSIDIPVFQVPGLNVKGINVALVPTLSDISSPTPHAAAMDIKIL